MKLLKTIKRTFSNRRGKLILASTTLAVLAAVAVPMIKAEWYPNRPAFDYNKPCNPNDNDKYDRCGSLTGPVFNSFVNTPSYGDERAFFDARRSDQTAAGSYENVLPNVTEGSREVVLRTYVHNNANQSTNASGLGVAKNAKVRILLPSAESQTLRARSYISASNATPQLVEDTVDLTADKKFRVEYIPGSAKIFSNGPVNGQKLSDNIVTTGALIGHNSLNGELPGCFEFEAVVQIRVKIKVNESDIQKQVRKAGEKQYSELAIVKPGERVEWLIRQDNKGTSPQTNVRVFDALPEHLEVVPGSVRWIYRGQSGQDQDVKMSDTDLFTKQVDFGTWQPNTFFYIRFDTKAKGDFEGCEVTLTNQARSRSNERPEEQRDNAQVKIVKEGCEEEQPGVPGPTETPEALPETGPGEVIATFVVVSAAGAVAYNVVMRRLYQA